MGTTTVADAAGLAGIYADRLLVGTTREVHAAITSRIFAATRQRHTPVGLIHNGVTAVVYGCIGLATRSVGQLGRFGLLSGDLEASPKGRRIRSAVNGLIGDVLQDQGSPMSITPSVRSRGRDVALNPDDLSHAFPTAGPRLAVFLHGLCEDDEAWAYQVDERGPSYLSRLEAETDWTPVAIRYNSGVPIQESAAAVARLIDDLVDAWPAQVHEIALVGHSMGGLVARAAANHARRAWWADRVTHVVLLGSPHGGAGLERVVEQAVPLMRRLPEVAPFGAILDERSIGIRDLRYGIGVDQVGWPRAAYHCVAATLGAGERHIVGRVFGDLLVKLDSARGWGAGLEADFLHVPGAHHFDLLNHPVIFSDLARWLNETPPQLTDKDTAHG